MGSNAHVNSETWQAIRALRAAPSAAAAKHADRRRTFGASLRQAEELAEAAQVAGYAARPLPLFYSLSQAGRAIAAAHLPTRWILRGHGLRVSPKAQPPLEATVEPMGSGGDSFSGVASAVGSPLLNGRVTLGNYGLRIPICGTSLSHRAQDLGRERSRSRLACNTWCGPPHPLGEADPDPEKSPVGTGGMLSVSVDLPGDTGVEIANALKPYPTLRGAFGLKQGTAGGERAGATDRVIRGEALGRDRATIALEAPTEMMMAELWRRQRALVSIVEIDERQPTYPAPTLVGFALPEMAGGPSPFPLLLWWALLLGLSSLARYEPAAWTAAIDLDASELAVGLERVLDVAAERVPARILQSLRA